MTGSEECLGMYLVERVEIVSRSELCSCFCQVFDFICREAKKPDEGNEDRRQHPSPSQATLWNLAATDSRNIESYSLMNS